MPQIDPIHPATSLHRPLAHSEDNGIALAERHNLGPGLHPWSLFGHHEFSAGKVLAHLREQNCHLQGEDVLPIDVLVETVVVIGSVLQQKWGGIPLSGFVASGNEFPMLSRKPHLVSERLIPPIRDWSQVGIKRSTESGEQRRQWIAEILVLAPAEAVTRHHHTGTESGIRLVQAS
jgi:hypothetical protein